MARADIDRSVTTLPRLGGSRHSSRTRIVSSLEFEGRRGSLLGRKELDQTLDEECSNEQAASSTHTFTWTRREISDEKCGRRKVRFVSPKALSREHTCKLLDFLRTQASPSSCTLSQEILDRFQGRPHSMSDGRRCMCRRCRRRGRK